MKLHHTRKVLKELYEKDLKSEYGAPTSAMSYNNAIEEIEKVEKRIPLLYISISFLSGLSIGLLFLLYL